MSFKILFLCYSNKKQKNLKNNVDLFNISWNEWKTFFEMF